MNIFVSDTDPVIAARNLDDKRVVKLTLEAAQLLAAVLESLGEPTPYKPTKQGRVFQEWMLANDNHYEWVRLHFLELCREYSYRYGRIHKCQLQISPCLHHVAYYKPPTTWINYAANRKLGYDFTDLRVPLSYQSYLNARWKTDKRKPIWTKRQPPAWAIDI